VQHEGGGGGNNGRSSALRRAGGGCDVVGMREEWRGEEGSNGAGSCGSVVGRTPLCCAERGEKPFGCETRSGDAEHGHGSSTLLVGSHTVTRSH
jgi:hypothetical protein